MVCLKMDVALLWIVECAEGSVCNESFSCDVLCVAATCEEIGSGCGTPDDGCGTPLECGGCDEFYTCSETFECVCDAEECMEMDTATEEDGTEADTNDLSCTPFCEGPACNFTCIDNAVYTCQTDTWELVEDCTETGTTCELVLGDEETEGDAEVLCVGGTEETDTTSSEDVEEEPAEEDSSGEPEEAEAEEEPTEEEPEEEAEVDAGDSPPQMCRKRKLQKKQPKQPMMDVEVVPSTGPPTEFPSRRTLLAVGIGTGSVGGTPQSASLLALSRKNPPPRGSRFLQSIHQTRGARRPCPLRSIHRYRSSPCTGPPIPRQRPPSLNCSTSEFL